MEGTRYFAHNHDKEIRETVIANRAEIAQFKAKLELCREGLQQAGWNATRLKCDCDNRPNEAIVCERCRIRIAVDKALEAIEGRDGI
jgi:hypothetical protein